ncbi:MAG TPA: alpha/beta hydrolase [Novosphingobium sp.]|nr:alpha/beta hydrolase [Novosphingobium sp.]
MAERRSAEFSTEIVGGRTLRVARWNWEQPGQHLPLLFFNGIGTNIEAITPPAEALTERAFMTFDMPGIGGSPEPVMPYTMSSMSLVVADLLDHFAVSQADLMGVSWGGGLAQHFALQHPSRVRRLVLAATSAGCAMIPGNPFAMASLADFAPMSAASPIGLSYQLLAMFGWTSAPALPFLRQDTLIMMGDADPVMPLANGHLLHTLIPNSRLEVVRGGGHWFMLSHQAQTLRALRRFLDASDNMERPNTLDKVAA